MDKALSFSQKKILKNVYILDLIKKGVWVYFFLLIFEGALRKWFLPFLSAPLLIVRDPIALWIIYMVWKHNIVKANFYVLAMTVFTLIAVITALITGHGSVVVAVYGARILIIHFPLIFIIGKVFNLEDVIKLGKILLIISIPMTVLIALQFYSPQTAWVNRGVGGDFTGAGFSGALGYFRPPGTFSFTTGNVMFYSLVTCYIFYFWIDKVKTNRLLLIFATISLLAAIPLSISRTLIFSVGATFIFMFMSIARQPKYLVRMLVFLLLGVLVVFVLTQTSFFETSSGVMLQRFENASNSEGTIADSILDRFFGGMITAVKDSNELPFFGFGIGMGTNAGSALLTGGRSFLIAEGEWLRLVGEMGFVLGILVLLIRVVFCIKLATSSYLNLKTGNLLPWLLLSFGSLYILQGQWAQPTILGFSTLSGGLILAAMNNVSHFENEINSTKDFKVGK